MYKPLAIRYRPTSLEEVIGQDLVVSIITSAIESDKLSNAIILTGIRGTGKTSIARIIAKAINCSSLLPKKPCTTCESCKLIDDQKTLDIVEMDAASNTGVDDVRVIIESCQYRPLLLKYKVFIIDEVHMLSKSAFNAILKTIEEPPLHAKFIFATTEIEKVPDTIISRCLRLDLKRVSQVEMAQYLSQVANKENISIEPRAIQIIAKASSGSVRDGLSILEQVFYLPQPIKEREVSQLLGVIDNDTIADFLSKLISQNTKAALKFARDIYEKSSSVRSIFEGVLELLHYMLCIKLNAVSFSDNFISTEVATKLECIAESLSIPSLNQIWQIILKGIDELKSAVNELLVLEMTVIRIAYLSPVPDLYELINTSKPNNTAPEEKRSITSVEDIISIIKNDNVLLSFFKQYSSLAGINGSKLVIEYSTKFPEKLRESLDNKISAYGYTIEWTAKDDEYKDVDELLEEAQKLFPKAKLV